MKALLKVTREVEYQKIVDMHPMDYKEFIKKLEGSYKEAKEAGRELNRLIKEDDWVDDEFRDAELEEYKEC